MEYEVFAEVNHLSPTPDTPTILGDGNLQTEQRGVATQGSVDQRWWGEGGIGDVGWGGLQNLEMGEACENLTESALLFLVHV